MSKFFFGAAFAAGAALLAWIAFGFAGGSWVPLAVTGAIAAAYGFGALELRRFRSATQSLATAVGALDAAPADLAAWLERLPASLRQAVRLRIEGERSALPAPALTPYLVGLLVMLGMLGTFLGMVVTFKGAVFALEGSSDLQAIRAALAEPIKGLGLSFGTSVAGVATSAMLGLMATIARRERVDVVRALDARIAGVLRPFSLAHQREETLQVLRRQADGLPQVVEALNAMMERIERRGEALDQQLLQRHAELQREVTQAYGGLAERVGASLRDNLAQSAQAAGDVLRPVVESAMAQIVDESRESQQRTLAATRALQAELGAVAQGQVEALSAQFGASTRTAAEHWNAALQPVTQRLESLVQQSEALARTRAESEARLLAEHGARMDTLQAAAAGVIAQLREETSRFAERDNAALAERNAMLERLGGLLQVVEQASGAQRAAIADASADVAAGAVELASLGESFAQGVQLFQAGNEKLVETLQRVEGTLQRSTARSDEQLAYYVAQAREVIDLSIASQQGLVENLRQLRAAPAVTEGAAG